MGRQLTMSGVLFLCALVVGCSIGAAPQSTQPAAEAIARENADAISRTLSPDVWTLTDPGIRLTFATADGKETTQRVYLPLKLQELEVIPLEQVAPDGGRKVTFLLRTPYDIVLGAGYQDQNGGLHRSMEGSGSIPYSPQPGQFWHDRTVPQPDTLKLTVEAPDSARTKAGVLQSAVRVKLETVRDGMADRKDDNAKPFGTAWYVPGFGEVLRQGTDGSITRQLVRVERITPERLPGTTAEQEAPQRNSAYYAQRKELAVYVRTLDDRVRSADSAVWGVLGMIGLTRNLSREDQLAIRAIDDLTVQLQSAPPVFLERFREQHGAMLKAAAFSRTTFLLELQGSATLRDMDETRKADESLKAQMKYVIEHL